MNLHRRWLMIGLLLLSASAGRSAILETFSDGNDDGWLHYDPLAEAYGPASFNVVNEAYQLIASDPWGGRMIASFLPISVATGSIGAQVTSFTPDAAPFLLMRADPNTSTSFVFALSPTHPGEGTPGALTAWKIVEGQLTLLGSQEFSNQANLLYSMNVWGEGNDFTFSVNPIDSEGRQIGAGASLSLTGDPLSTGLVGLGITNNLEIPGATLGAQFDNVFVGYSLTPPPVIPEPTTIGLVLIGLAVLRLRRH